MGYNRTRKETNEYNTYLKSKKNSGNRDCDFCKIHGKSPQLIRQTTYFKIIRNIFPYSIWDGRKVTDHLLLIPNEHTESLSTLTPEAMQQYTLLIAEYELIGYNIYARTPDSTMKSVAHQHTHLIMATGNRVRFLMQLEKPNIRIML